MLLRNISTILVLLPLFIHVILCNSSMAPNNSVKSTINSVILKEELKINAENKIKSDDDIQDKESNEANKTDQSTNGNIDEEDQTHSTSSFSISTTNSNLEAAKTENKISEADDMNTMEKKSTSAINPNSETTQSVQEISSTSKSTEKITEAKETATATDKISSSTTTVTTSTNSTTTTTITQTPSVFTTISSIEYTTHKIENSTISDDIKSNSTSKGPETSPSTTNVPTTIILSNNTDKSKVKKLSSGYIALVATLTFALIVLVTYFGLVLWRRYLEYRYGNRQLLVNEMEFDTTTDFSHFEL